MQVNRELVKWAKETYLGLAEEQPPTVARITGINVTGRLAVRQ
jgi:hypothetical protein